MPKVMRQPRQLSAKELAEIREIYELGLLNLTELAERYKVSRSGIDQMLKREGLIYGSKAAAATREQLSDLDDDLDLVIARAKECRDNTYKWSTLLSKLAIKKVHAAELSENGYTWDQAEQEIRVLQSAMRVVGDGRKERYTVLGLDREDLLTDDLPELNISEMSESDILEVKRDQIERLKASGGLASDLLYDENGDLIDEDED